jgi:hypothetical protein
MLNELNEWPPIEPSYAAWEAAVLPLNYTRDRRNSTTVSDDSGVRVRGGGHSTGGNRNKKGPQHLPKQ